MEKLSTPTNDKNYDLSLVNSLSNEDEPKDKPMTKAMPPAALVSKNIMIDGRRTSIRLEPSMWDALEEVCSRERCTIHQICTLISSRLSCSSFTAAVRVFVLSYYRAAATEMGHASAGHGSLGHIKS